MDQDPATGSHTGTRGVQESPGWPRQNWKGVVKDLSEIGISWDEVEEAAEDRRSWWNRVAQCVFDAGWTMSQEDSAAYGNCDCVITTTAILYGFGVDSWPLKTFLSQPAKFGRCTANGVNLTERQTAIYMVRTKHYSFSQNRPPGCVTASHTVGALHPEEQRCTAIANGQLDAHASVMQPINAAAVSWQLLPWFPDNWTACVYGTTYCRTQIQRLTDPWAAIFPL